MKVEVEVDKSGSEVGGRNGDVNEDVKCKIGLERKKKKQRVFLETKRERT